MKGNRTNLSPESPLVRMREAGFIKIMMDKYPYPITLNVDFYDEMRLAGWTRVETNYAIE